MKKRDRKQGILVYADWVGMREPRLMGTLHTELLRGKEVFSFTYDERWLNTDAHPHLDPDLHLYSGPQYLSNEKPNFGLFLDSSPDRWGCVLMKRREAALAQHQGRQEHTLFESDYLMGVDDRYRMGALRFKFTEDGPFMDDNPEMEIPPWTSVRELESISLQLEEDNAASDPDYLRWLSMMLAPGSSLGGARPKASVIDPGQNLWIAKFPSKHDLTDAGAWEMVAHQLAINASIRMAECQARKLSGRFHTFLARRFDRTSNGKRLHFASAMTMLGYTDRQDLKNGASYLEMVEFITRHGCNIEADLEELWRRIVFNICISNTDDHLRNHGFMLTPEGWILSPAYDLNPNEFGNGLSLNISDTDNALSLDLALQVRDFFRLSEKSAQLILGKVISSVKNWRSVAGQFGLSKTELDYKAAAFSQVK